MRKALEQIKNKNGITLIALVITIIVLLVLAGVTIVTLTGDNGLLQKAQTAKEENEKAKEVELIKLAVSAAQVAGEGTLTTTNLKNELEVNLKDNDIDNNFKPISNYWTYNGYKIDNDGNVEKLLLPKEYQQVEYIESTGTQYINSEIIATTKDCKFDILLEYTKKQEVLVEWHLDLKQIQTIGH